MKKLITVLLIFVLLLSFSGCKKDYDPTDISDIEITFCQNYEEYENKNGKTVPINPDKADIIVSIAERMTENGKSTTKPMDMPRYEIRFVSGKTKHTIYVDYDNTFAASFLDGGNYFCLSDYDYYSDIHSLYNEALNTENPVESEPLEEPSGSPYLSISCVLNSTENPEEKSKSIFCYDLKTEELSEICTFPADINAYSAQYSRTNNAVYYYDFIVPGNYSSGIGIFEYDLSTKNITRLDNANYSYNELKIVDENTLLLMAVMEHTIAPIYFDIETGNFLCIDDYNGPTLYNSGATSFSYNPITESLTYIRWNETEADSEYSSAKKSIDHFITVYDSSSGNIKNVYAHNAKIDELNLWYATQISENEFIVLLMDAIGFMEPEYYSLILGEEATFTKIESPCPAVSNMHNFFSPDGGETFYFYYHGGKPGPASGIYKYSAENGGLFPIISSPEEYSSDFMSFSLIIED